MDSFSLYVHLPYCVKKCPYCDFNSYEFDQEKGFGESSYLVALLKELSHYAETSDFSGDKLSSIFFGGGTPSLFSPQSIAEIISSAKNSFESDLIEITLEANPGSIKEPSSTEKLEGFLNAGVNRVSLGIQSFDDAKLKFLGRVHTSADSEVAINNLKQAGFENFNLDLIFGCKDESVESWERDLEIAITHRPKHISAYSLTIEPGTVFGRLAKENQRLTASDEKVAQMFALAQKILSASGYKRYEISNFSLPNYRCQHNLNYWRNKSYLGIGAGAHSFLANSKLRWKNHLAPAKYISEINKNSLAAFQEERITKEQAELEFLFLGLRTTEGISLDDYFGQFSNEKIEEVFKKLEAEKLVNLDNRYLKLTEKGFLFSDRVFSELAI